MCPRGLCLADRSSYATDAPSQVTSIHCSRNREWKRNSLGDGMVRSHLEIPWKQVWEADGPAITPSLLPPLALLVSAVR